MGKKVWLIIAAFLVIIGLVLFSAIMMTYNWDFSKLNTEKYQTSTYEITEQFTDISIQTDTADIDFILSEDGICKVTCFEQENIKYSVAVENDTLTVSSSDEREWYDYINITSNTSKITIYLPKAQYDTLFIEESTGDICIENISANSLDISLSTGDVIVSNTAFANDIKIDLSTGDVRLTDITCNNIVSNGSTGDIYLKNIIAAQGLTAARDTGNIRLDGVDAEELVLETSTGDITGSLLTPKIFVTETSTGDISVPQSVSGGKCEITTSTGDIDISIQ